MADLATLLAQRERLLEIRAKGIRSYEIALAGGGSRTLTYRDDDELAAAIADLNRQIAAATGGNARPVRTVYINPSKGT